MRYSEIFEAASRLPAKYVVDPDTDLGLNLPNQWSESPYLGAVRSPSGGFMAQIHVPQDVWTAMVDQNPGKWTQAPKSFFNATGNQRPSMIVRFKDPRKAAWFAQEVLYGGDLPTREIIEDYFDERYNGGDGAVWRGMAGQAPNFQGELLKPEDEARVFANRDEHQKKVVARQNASSYEPQMKAKIRKELLDFYGKNRQLAQKRLGRHKSLNDMAGLIDQLIDAKGVEFFVTAPGSVKLKNIASLNLK